MMTDTAVLARANRVNAAAASDRGRMRTGNEDRHYVDVDRGVFLVVDGVGGHAAGEVAAAIAVDVITQRLERPIGTPAQRVREAIALANNEILRQAERSPAHAGMTCVLTLALLTEDQLTIGHVGDSRLYKLTRDGLRKLTHDHSPIGEREDAQEISEAEAMKHPRRSEVFRDVGSAFHEPDDPDFIELVDATFEPDAALLLCSDGLSDMISSAVILRTVREQAGAPDRVVQSLDRRGEQSRRQRQHYGRLRRRHRLRGCQHGARRDARAAGRNRLSSPNAVDLARGGPTRRPAGWAGPERVAAIRHLRDVAPDADALGRACRRSLGPGGGGQYPTIAAAITASRPGDLIQLEPGEYAERVVLKDGVDLVAREPGTATVVAPSGDLGWATITVNGRLGSRISGLRLLGRPDSAAVGRAASVGT